MFHLSIPGKTPKTLATTLALLLCLLLAPLSEAQAGTFRCQYFTLNLPQNWKLIKSPKYMGTSQAWFDTTRKGQQFRFIFCQDDAAQVLAIYILNGKPKDMDFIRTGMKTKYKGLVPQKITAK